MAILRDEQGNPKPQYETATTNVFEAAKGSGGNIHVDVKASALPAGASTEVTLAALLAKMIAAPATEATLAALLAKVIAAPSTEAKQDTLIAKDFATQTTLAALLTKVIAAPATEAKQDTQVTSIDALATLLTAIKSTDGIKKITDAVTLADREIEEIFVVNALAITDTSPHITDVVDTSKYKKIFVWANSSLSQPVTASVLTTSTADYKVWNGSAWVLYTDPSITPTITGDNCDYLLNTMCSHIDNEPIKGIRLYLNCAVAPVSGSLTVKLWGVPN